MSSSGQAVHDRVVKHIAKTRFPFEDQTDWPPDYRTIVNVGNPQVGMRSGRHTHYPDIVVVDGQGRAREVAEVEMEIKPQIAPRLSIASRGAPEIPGTGVRHFFLYVPAEQREAALEFVRNYRISYAGLRTFEVGPDGTISIEPVDTPGHAKDHRST